MKIRKIINGKVIVALIPLLAVLLQFVLSFCSFRTDEVIKSEIHANPFENPLDLQFYSQYTFEYNANDKLVIQPGEQFNGYLLGIGFSDKEGGLKEKIRVADTRAILDLSLSAEVEVTDFTIVQSTTKDEDNYIQNSTINSRFLVDKEIYIVRRVYINDFVLSLVVLKENVQGIKKMRITDTLSTEEIDSLFEITPVQSKQEYDITIETKSIQYKNDDTYSSFLSVTYPNEHFSIDDRLEDGTHKEYSKIDNTKFLDFVNINPPYHSSVRNSKNYNYSHIRNKTKLICDISNWIRTKCEDKKSAIYTNTIISSRNKIESLTLVYFEIDKATMFERYIYNYNVPEFIQTKEIDKDVDKAMREKLIEAFSLYQNELN